MSALCRLLYLLALNSCDLLKLVSNGQVSSMMVLRRQTSQMIMHIQSPDIITTIYSSIFKDIKTYSGILMHIQPQPNGYN